MARARSYRFVVDERLLASSKVHTRVAGRVVRRQGLAYQLLVGHKRTQVVRLPHATYVRAVPQRWSKLRKPRRLANPTRTLLIVLGHLRPTGLHASHGARTVTGLLPAAASHRAGLPSTGAADVRVTLDRAGHVTHLSIRTTTRAAGHDVGVRLAASYRGFGKVPRIRRPV